MKDKMLKVLKPLSFLAVAAVAAGSFIAVAGDGECPLKAAKAAADGGTCRTAAKAAKAEGTCPLSAKMAEAKGTCPLGAKTAKAGSCDGGTCPTAAKTAKAEGCEGGVCPGKDIVNTVLQDGEFTTLLLAARAADMMDQLTCSEPKTLLAPTNQAFQQLPAEQWAALLQDDEALRAVLSRHIIQGAVPVADLATSEAVCSSLGAKHCNVSGKTTIGSANVVKADIAASNGYIHVIDRVLLPEESTDVAAAESPSEQDSVQVASAE